MLNFWKYISVIAIFVMALLVVNNLVKKFTQSKEKILEKTAEGVVRSPTNTLATSSLPKKLISRQLKIGISPVIIPLSPKPPLPLSIKTAPASPEKKEEVAPTPAVVSLPTPSPAPLPVSTLPSLPSLDEESLLKSVVKIQCPTEDGLGKYIGSGFVLPKDLVITAAHVIMDSASRNCDVIFPRERRSVYYLRGITEDLGEVKRRHDEEGIDVALLRLPSLESYPEARQIFSAYPSIPYPICENPAMLEDKLLHFGYPSNYVDQNYLSELDGLALAYADIKGIRDQLSADGTYSYKSPIFGFTRDELKLHPFMLSRVPSFYGDSGGLAFNATKQCILGPHRGGTIGRGAGENYSVFIMLGWEKAKNIITSPRF